jgi:hypothetical protein
MSVLTATKRRIVAYCATTLLCLSLVGVGLASAAPGSDHGGPVNPGKACGHSNSSAIMCSTTTSGTATTSTGTTTGAATTVAAACHATQTSTTGTTTTASTTVTATTTTTSTAATTLTTASSTTTTGTTTGARVASFFGKATPSHPCGTIQVQAKVLHPARGTSFSASATAHFVSGDVTVSLRRAGKSFVALGKIPVPSTQPAGSVGVDISIVSGGSTTTVETTSEIVAP